MLKSFLLASAVMISAPAFAQDMQETVPPAQEQAAPDTMTDPVETPDAEPMTEPTPAPTPMPAPTPEPTPAPTPEPTGTPEPQASEQSAQATTPAEQPAETGQQPANAVQIAQIVDQGFPTYDKDADGSLKQEEFGSWMVALRSASEPAFTGESVADKEWIGRALAAADADQSGGVTKDELKTFLAPAAAS